MSSLSGFVSLSLGSSAFPDAGTDAADNNLHPSWLLLHLPLWAVISVAAFLLQFVLFFCAVIFLENRLRRRPRSDGLAAKRRSGRKPSVVGGCSIASGKDEKFQLTAMDVLYLQLRNEKAQEVLRAREQQDQPWPEHQLGTGAESTSLALPDAAACATGLANSSYENFSVAAEVHD